MVQATHAHILTGGGGGCICSWKHAEAKGLSRLCLFFLNSPTESCVSTTRLKVAADLRVNVSEAGGAHGPALSVHILKVWGFFPTLLSEWVCDWWRVLDSFP